MPSRPTYNSLADLVDACEVTNRQQTILVQHPTARTHSLGAQNEPPDYRGGSLFYQDPRFSAESRPVTGVISRCLLHCKAVGGRLPQSEEWEAIAAGAIGSTPGAMRASSPLGEVNDQGAADNIGATCIPRQTTSEGVYDSGTPSGRGTMGRYPQGSQPKAEVVH